MLVFLQFTHEVFFSCFKLIILYTPSQVFLHSRNKVGYHFRKPFPLLMILEADIRIQFKCKVSGAVYQTTPHTSALPPTVISGVGPENKEQTKNNSQKLMHPCGRLKISQMQLEIINHH